MIKKFLQSIGCSLAELRDVLQEHDAHTITNEQTIEWIRSKMKEIEDKKKEYDQMLDTLRKMLEYRTLLKVDPQKAEAFLKNWKAEAGWN